MPSNLKHQLGTELNLKVAVKNTGHEAWKLDTFRLFDCQTQKDLFNLPQLLPEESTLIKFPANYSDQCFGKFKFDYVFKLQDEIVGDRISFILVFYDQTPDLFRSKAN